MMKKIRKADDEGQITTVCQFLPDDMMAEILSRLPVKSLVRFRCVSKPWLHFISSPSFKTTRAALRNPNHQFVLIVKLGSTGLRTPRRFVSLHVVDMFQGKLQWEFNLPRGYCSHHYSSTCHGLVYFSDLRGKHVYVCNPSTRELVKLPVSPFAICLFRTSNVGIGMGYLPESNTYKVVVWFAHILNGGFEVFTLTDGGNPRSCMWEIVKKHPGFVRPPKGYRGKGLSVKGEVYWVVTPDDDGYIRNGWKLLAFDLRTEQERMIQPPVDWVERGGWSSDVIELRDSLCLVDTKEFIPQKFWGTTEIWELGDGDKWAKTYVVSGYRLPRLLYCIPYSECKNHPLGQLVKDVAPLFECSSKLESIDQETEEVNLVFMPKRSGGDLDLDYNHLHYCPGRGSLHSSIVF